MANTMDSNVRKLLTDMRSTSTRSSAGQRTHCQRVQASAHAGIGRDNDGDGDADDTFGF